MKIKTVWLAGLVVLFSAVSAVFAEAKSKEELAQMAISTDAAVSAEAVKNLRALGSDGLDALARKYAVEIAKFSRDGEATDQWKRIAAALDAVAMQKDAYASNLFWFTDFEEAKREAQKTNKTILSLRLLGNLNEEFSCANSRFFRALLYSNAEVSNYLRANYVLHWKAVRPAPRVTIDFGDGRRIERTVTGNSIHYALDRDGAIIDAIPGLYSPSGFLKYLVKSSEIDKKTASLPKAQKEAALLRHRRQMFDEISLKREKLLAAAKIELREPELMASPEGRTEAVAIAPIAATKMMTERPILYGIADGFARYEPQMNLENWRKLANLYAAATRFDEATLAFIKRQNKQTGLTDDEFAALLTKLTNYVALDTTRNDFLLHPKLYEWLNSPRRAGALDLESFNARVYAELFKTPASDRWLGLYETDVYTALDGGGIIR